MASTKNTIPPGDTTADAPHLPDEPSLRRPHPPADVRQRLRDVAGAALYMDVSEDMILRLIHTGALPVVKLPVERGSHGRGTVGVSRRNLIDTRDMDALIERSKETRR
jgi:hypothetical protein